LRSSALVATMNTTNATGVDSDRFSWSHPNIPFAIGISLGSGLATAVGGSMVFCPELLRRVPQATVLAVSLALSAGVMLYVSFIEIFVKANEAIASTEGISEGAAAVITTVCFFAGMGICAMLELLVHCMSKASDQPDLHEAICAAHGPAHGPVHNPAHGHALEGTHTDTRTNPSTAEKHGDKEVAAPSVKVHVADDGDIIGDAVESNALARMGLMTALAIAIHNFPEGLATFLATVEDTRLGASLGVAIAIHNIPEGLCVAMPIYYASGSKGKAFLWSVLSGLTEPIGGILGFWSLQSVFTPLVFGIVFAMVGGMMIFIVCHELLPAAHKYMGNNAKTTAWLILGMAIMAVSLVMFSM